MNNKPVILLLPILMLNATAALPATAARIIAAHGYDNLIELGNGTCRVVLEPNMGGRVLNYQINGIEVLSQDPAQAGLHPTMAKGVPRIAGGRFDIGPSFGERPRRMLWQGQWTGEITGEYSARLTSQVDPDSRVQLIRNFTLAQEGTQLRCEQVIINHGDQPLWTLHWSRTMCKGGGIAFAPVPEMGHFPNGYALSTGSRGGFDFLPDPEPAIRIRDGILEFLEAPSQDKAIFNLSAGWMAYLTTDDVLFVKKFPFNPEWRYGDPTQHHGSYWWLEDRLVEFEPNGPLEIIPPGGRASFHEDWWLVPFAFPEDRSVDLDKLREAVDKCAVPSDRPLSANPAPNILMIYVDDMGYGDVTAYNEAALAPTPHIDSLARDGIRFTSGYVTASVCAPSRVGLMSGAYQQRFGCYWNPHSKGTKLGTQQLMPQVLKAAGYATGLIGKWNIAAAPETVFDEVHEIMDWEGDYLPDANGNYKGVNSGVDSGKTWKWGPEREGDEYLTDRLGRHAAEFIARHANAKEPFFLYMAFNAPHSPLQAKKAYRERFAHIDNEALKLYAAMVASLDENVGRILAELDRQGIAENTIVAFVSDNGPARGGFKGYPDGVERVVMGSTAGKRGHKGTVYDGGSGVPFLIRWPAALPSGSLYEKRVSTLDLLPTFAVAAGAAVPAENIADGVNLLPYLTGKQAGEPHEILFWWNLEDAAIVQGDWKLVVTSKPASRELYNLADDPNETTNVMDGHLDLAGKLYQAWVDWSKDLPPPPPARERPAK